MRVVRMHGIHEDGQRSVGIFDAPLRSLGHEVDAYRYGAPWWPLALHVLMARVWNGRRAKDLRALIGERPSVGFGFSNGCPLLLRAARLGAPLERLVFVNPALDDDVELPAQVRQAVVFYTTDDLATGLAAPMLWWHEWGDMGEKGYRGQDARWVSFNMTKGIRRSLVAGELLRTPGKYFNESEHGHGGVFHPGRFVGNDFWHVRILAALALHEPVPVTGSW